MYRKKQRGIWRHIDFIVFDMFSLQVAFALAFIIRNDGGNPYADLVYRNIAIVLELIDLIVILFFGTMRDVLKRGYYMEFIRTGQHVILVELLTAMYLVTVQEGELFSRFILYSFAVLYMLISYPVRLLWKAVLRKQPIVGVHRSLLILAPADKMERVVQNIRENQYDIFRIAGLAVSDCDMTGKTIEEIPVVANLDTLVNYVCKEWIDEVYIEPDGSAYDTKKLMEKFMEMGVTVHINLDVEMQSSGGKQFVEKIGEETVLTASINTATLRQAVLKRTMDIAGGVIGCILTGIIFIFVAPAIFISSPGPIFFSQIRVGKNGKRFKMYKFRTMYPDAEERKKELIKNNRIGDGRMFKLEFDPRIIGNRVLPDGTQKKGIGQFLRITSLDEFPQFFNVLKGDMSLVGTRPPTEDEWEQYELHHRIRLSVKPGISGLWQVSGRSNITSFEEVVNLDTQYILKWSMGLDIKILLKTLLVVFKKEGAL